MKLLATAIAFSLVAVAAHAAEPVVPAKDQQALLKSSEPAARREQKARVRHVAHVPGRAPYR